jgi:predicted enzyme related to lactoylglutathione lyase
MYYIILTSKKKGNTMKNAINWFEIPVLDFERGIKFYSAILGCELNKLSMGRCEVGLFP